MSSEEDSDADSVMESSEEEEEVEVPQIQLPNRATRGKRLEKVLNQEPFIAGLNHSALLRGCYACAASKCLIYHGLFRLSCIVLWHFLQGFDECVSIF